jgi:glycosyltransferase involved in cell wall biosynthesis
MRIAVNTRLLLPDRLEGLGTFTHEVLRRMVKQHPEHEFIFLFDRPWDERFIYGENVIPVWSDPPARHALLFIYWFELVVPRLLKKYKADIFLSPDGYLSLQSDVKQVPVIHDLNFEHHPEFFSLANKLHYKNFFFRYAKKAARIATVSDFSKKDLVTTYNIDEQKIDVVYNGVDSIYQPAIKTETDKLKKELTDGKDYFVFVGGLYPRKNLKNAILAFEKFKTETGSDIKFIIAGKRYKESESVFNVYEKLKHKQDIIFLGRVEPREKISVLLSGSHALVYVSLFEGFGLPIIEAMRCETSVITSDITAMPEIAGGAALLVNPLDTDEIAQAMQIVVEKPQLRNELIEKGRRVAKKFNWEETSDLLWECITKAWNHK